MSVRFTVLCVECRKEEYIVVCEKFDEFNMRDIGDTERLGICYDCQEKIDDGE